MRCCMHILFLFCRPTGPGHRPSLFIFFIFDVFGISCPRFLPKIPESYSGYSHWGSARDGPSSARVCPPSWPSPPSPCFAEVQGTLFLRVQNAVFQPQLFWAPVGFCGVRLHKTRRERARFVVLLGSTKRVSVPYSGPYSRCQYLTCLPTQGLKFMSIILEHFSHGQMGAKTTLMLR